MADILVVAEIAGRCRRPARLVGLAAAVAAILLPAGAATAQTRDQPILRPPVIERSAPGRMPATRGVRPGGGGGFGVGGAIGLGLGILGAAAAAGAADADEPASGRAPRRNRVIEIDEDARPIRAERRDEDRPPPRRRPPREAAPPPPPAVRLPAAGETRFVPGEVLVETRGDAGFEAVARRLGLEILGRRSIRLTGTTLFRVGARDGRATSDILKRLRRERSIAAAQPNWLYTLQQDAIPARPAAETVPATSETPAEPSIVPRVGTATVPASAEPATVPASVSPSAATVPGPLPGQYFPGKLNLAAAHGRAKGTGVRVAVIDTDVDATHPELVDAIEASFDALDGAAAAVGGHGTAMAGAVAARSRLAGAAPASRLLLARAFGAPKANGVAQGSTWHVVACLDWSVERRARVVSMSFAGPPDDLLARGLAAARARGVVMVAAAGNAGPQSPPLFPASDPAVIAVTASDADDRVLPAAVRGGHVAVAAPGVDILVAAPRGGYDLTSGTSVAAAEVAGVAALLLERRPDIAPAEARRILMETARDLGPAGRDPIFGAGLVDAEAAVRAAARGR